MKILWLSHFAPFPPKGGALQRTYNMLKQVSKYADIDLISLATYSKISAFYAQYEEGVEEIENELSLFCNSVVLVKHGRYSRKFSRNITAIASLLKRACYDVICLESREYSDKVQLALSENNYDFVYFDTVGLCPLVSIGDTPYILNHHNIESDMLLRRAGLASGLMAWYMNWQARLLKDLEIQFAANAYSNFVCSELDEVRLSGFVSARVEVVPNGVDLGYFTRRVPYDCSKTGGMIFAGGLDWYPNRDAMLLFANEIWPKLKETAIGRELTMTVVGKGSISRINEISEADTNMHVTGFVDDVRDYIEKCAIYICPIRDGGGTKLKMLDAMAMGMPIVAHPVSCEGLDIEPGVQAEVAESSEDFCSKIVELMQSPDRRMLLSAAARKHAVERFDYDAIGKKIFNVISDQG